MKKAEKLPLTIPIAAATQVKRLRQANVISMHVLRLADGAYVHNMTCACTPECKMDAALCLTIFASGAKKFPVGIEIDSAGGDRKRVIDVFLLLAFQFPIFLFQCRISRLEIGKFQLDVGGVELRSGKVILQVGNAGHKIGIPNELGRLRNDNDFRTKRCEEVSHV